MRSQILRRGAALLVAAASAAVVVRVEAQRGSTSRPQSAAVARAKSAGVAPAASDASRLNAVITVLRQASASVADVTDAAQRQPLTARIKKYEAVAAALRQAAEGRPAVAEAMAAGQSYEFRDDLAGMLQGLDALDAAEAVQAGADRPVRGLVRVAKARLAAGDRAGAVRTLGRAADAVAIDGGISQRDAFAEHAGYETVLQPLFDARAFADARAVADRFRGPVARVFALARVAEAQAAAGDQTGARATLAAAERLIPHLGDVIAERPTTRTATRPTTRPTTGSTTRPLDRGFGGVRPGGPSTRPSLLPTTRPAFATTRPALATTRPTFGTTRPFNAATRPFARGGNMARPTAKTTALDESRCLTRIAAAYHAAGDEQALARTSAAAYKAASQIPDARGRSVALTDAAVEYWRAGAVKAADEAARRAGEAADQVENDPIRDARWQIAMRLGNEGHYRGAVDVASTLGAGHFRETRDRLLRDARPPATPEQAGAFVKAFTGAQTDRIDGTRSGTSRMVRAMALAGDAAGARKLAGDNPDALQSVAAGLAAAGKFREAVAAVDWVPAGHRPYALADVARAQLAAADVAGAAATLDAAAEYVPALGDAWVEIGRAAAKAGDWAAARHAGVKARGGRQIEELVNAMLRAGRIDDALAAIEAAKTGGTTRGGGISVYPLAQAYAAAGNPKAATETLASDLSFRHPAPDREQRLAVTVAGLWAARDVAAAAKWAAALKSPDTRVLALLAVARAALDQLDPGRREPDGRFRNPNALLR